MSMVLNDYLKSAVSSLAIMLPLFFVLIVGYKILSAEEVCDGDNCQSSNVASQAVLTYENNEVTLSKKPLTSIKTTAQNAYHGGVVVDDVVVAPNDNVSLRIDTYEDNKLYGARLPLAQPVDLTNQSLARP